MGASLRLIVGPDALARRRYTVEGRGDWAQAMPLVLEKLGYLDFEVAEPDVLEDERTWGGHRALLIADLPSAAWTPRALELARAGAAPAVIELPPRELHGALGIQAAAPAGHEGVVTVVSKGLRSAVESATAGWHRARLEYPVFREVPRDPAQDWTTLKVPIGAEQAERWRAPGWRVERWTTGDRPEVLATWAPRDGTGRWPALLRYGRLTAACFSLLGYLGQQTTVPPTSGLSHANHPRSVVLEALLAALLDHMHLQARLPRVRVMPWPAGARWALNIRHDYDRELSIGEIERIISLHRRTGSAATWYWRARFLNGDSDRAAVVRRINRTKGQEVAHHTEQLWRESVREQRTIERAIAGPISGSCAHGDPSCFRWQGAPNVLWAERSGLSYTEFISHAHVQPHRFCALEPDGRLVHGHVICLPHHLSLDTGATPQEGVEQILRGSKDYLQGGGMLQILSHPDMNIDLLFGLVDRLQDEGRIDMTARDAADWWRRSHVRDELQVLRAEGTVTLVSKRGVRGLVVELLQPDGRRTQRLVQIDPGGSIVLSTSGMEPPTIEDPGRQRLAVWRRQAVPVLAEAARAYYASQGIASGAPEVRTTIATNTDLVPARVELILGYLHDLQGLQTLRDCRVLDLGSGFGAFAAYLALDPESPRVTAVDIRADFVALTSQVVARLGLDNLDAKVADMRSLEGLPDAAFDVVILNNSFLYLTSKLDMKRSIAEIWRVLRPGGRVAFFHANRWRLTEPFTGAPIVHLLPRRAADAVCSVTGWRHNHGRVLLVSAPWLRRQLRHQGFENARSDARRGGPLRSLFARFYAVTAVKPGY